MQQMEMVSLDSKHMTRLKDMLSEFMIVEMAGKQIYDICLNLSKNPDHLKTFQKFGDQTQHHIDILTGIIKNIGGDPNYMSEDACLAEMKGMTLVDSAKQTKGLTQQQIELNCMDSLVLGETKCHSDWEILSDVAGKINDDRIRNMISGAADEILPQEDAHVRWSSRMLERMSLQDFVQA